MSLPLPDGWAVVALLLATWFISLVIRALAARWRLSRHHAKQRAAIRGEHDAVRVLREEGYRVIDSQVPGRWNVWVDGEATSIDLQADHVVELDGRYYVAEVKTGSRAPSIRTAKTRRQLLEYLFAYDVDGVLLVDMEHGRVHTIDFDIP